MNPNATKEAYFELESMPAVRKLIQMLMEICVSHDAKIKELESELALERKLRDPRT